MGSLRGIFKLVIIIFTSEISSFINKNDMEHLSLFIAKPLFLKIGLKDFEEQDFNDENSFALNSIQLPTPKPP